MFIYVLMPLGTARSKWVKKKKKRWKGLCLYFCEAVLASVEAVCPWTTRLSSLLTSKEPPEEVPLVGLQGLQQNWGLWCQKQVSQAGISNCIPQYSVGCNYLSLPEIPLFGTKVHNSSLRPIICANEKLPVKLCTKCMQFNSLRPSDAYMRQ